MENAVKVIDKMEKNANELVSSKDSAGIIVKKKKKIIWIPNYNSCIWGKF